MYIKDKVIFIDNTLEKKKENFFCLICDYPLITKDDFDYNRSYNCCNECYLKFAEARKEEWNNGWRPDNLSIREYLKIRKSLNER